MNPLPLLFVRIDAPLCLFDFAPCLITADRSAALANADGIVYFYRSTIDKLIRYVVPMEQSEKGF
jgi:hypothetical protein